MVIIMFEGEKTYVFWIGLIILGYSITQFVSAIWQTMYYFTATYGQSLSSLFGLSLVPGIASGIIFMTIGVYMMKAGTKKKVTESNIA